MTDAGARAAELREQLAYHGHRYYVLDDPEIGDDAYDALIDELRAIEQEHPELRTPESPTQRVGGQPLEKFQQVRHGEPMFSLANARSREEFRAWETRLHNRLRQLDIEPGELRFVSEPKIDGLAISLTPVHFDLTYREGLGRLRDWDLEAMLRAAMTGAA